MNGNGSTSAAEPEDQQVAAQQHRGRAGRILSPRSASGISAMMISALKITADSTALAGECRRMMLSASSCG